MPCQQKSGIFFVSIQIDFKPTERCRHCFMLSIHYSVQCQNCQNCKTTIGEDDLTSKPKTVVEVLSKFNVSASTRAIFEF